MDETIHSRLLMHEYNHQLINVLYVMPCYIKEKGFALGLINDFITVCLGGGIIFENALRVFIIGSHAKLFEYNINLIVSTSVFYANTCGYITCETTSEYANV